MEKNAYHSKNSKENHNDHLPGLLYIAGILLFLVALFFQSSKVQNGTFLLATVLSGYHVVLEGLVDTVKNTHQEHRFRPNVHILMTIAAIGAMIIGDYREAALLILIFAGAHFLEEYAEGRSKREITNLLKMNPTEARLIQYDGSFKIVDVSTLKIGDRLQVLNGDQIPTDGVILNGASAIDEASISGESIPQEKTVGDEVYGSTINGNGSFTMEVTKDNKDTLFAQIIQMVDESQANLSQTATKIQKIEPFYVIIVLIVVPLFILTGPIIFGWTWDESFYKGMVALISASPCALAASAVPATLSGISNLATKGVLFKGGSYLSNLAQVKAVAFDKTGTLTNGEPVVTDAYFNLSNLQITEEKCVNIIVAMEKTANHPLADAILDKFQATEELDLFVENNIGRGLEAEYQGDTYHIGKPQLFEQVSQIIMDYKKIYTDAGKTVVYFAQNEQVIGLIAMMDLPNEAARKVVKYLKNQEIHTTMITGDSESTGIAVGRKIGIDEVIGNVLPENKAEIVQDQKSRFGMVAMLGDGVNDAPALVNADIGVAMGEGTDIAIDVADAVLMKNDLTKFAYAHRVSKKLNKVVMQNIVFSMSVIILLLILNILDLTDITIGIIAHEGSTLLVILNGLRLLIPIKQKAD